MKTTACAAVARTFLWQHKGLFLWALFWRALYVIAPMQVPLITGTIVDGLTGRGTSLYGVTWTSPVVSEVLSCAVFALLGVAALYGISAFGRMMSTARLSRSFVTNLRHRIVQHSARLSLAQHRKLGSGELLERTIADTRSMRQFIDRVYIQTVANGIRLIYPILMLFVLDWSLALVCLAVLPPQWLISRALQRRLHAAAGKRRATQSELTIVVKENLDNTETLKALNADVASMQNIQACAVAVEKDELGANRYAALLNANVWLMTSVGLALVWWLGGMRVAAGTMTLGGLVVFTGFVGFAYLPFRMFSQIVATYRQGVVSLQRIADLLSIEPDIADAVGARRLEICDGRVEMDNVSFSYGSERVLDEVDLTIHPRRITAVVGPSGSGKSSLLRLLTRIYDPDAGRIAIDDQPLADVTLDSLRSQVALVTQQSTVFTGTVLDNLTMAKPSADMAEVEDACTAAGAIEFIDQLEEGFQTKIGSGAASLSGGQVQRLALARALLNKPRILLLDEPTSALDPENEAAMIATLQRLKNTMTIVVVAHRPQTIHSADDVVVLQSGRVVAEGDRNSVYARSPIFREFLIGDGAAYAEAA